MANGETQRKKGGCWKYFAIGCASVFVLVVIGGFLAYLGIKGCVSRLAEQYTATAPSELPGLQISDQEAEAVLKRVEAFTTAIKANQSSSALELTTKDINALIHKHPKWTNMAGRAYVTIEGDTIRGEASIPLDEIGGILKGRWLNGSVVFRVEMTAGRLLVFIDSVTVKGEALPEDFMKSLRVKNFAENANQDPDTVSVLQKLKSITVRDGAIRIVPKQVQ